MHTLHHPRMRVLLGDDLLSLPIPSLADILLSNPFPIRHSGALEMYFGQRISEAYQFALIYLPPSQHVEWLDVMKESLVCGHHTLRVRHLDELYERASEFASVLDGTGSTTYATTGLQVETLQVEVDMMEKRMSGVSVLSIDEVVRSDPHDRIQELMQPVWEELAEVEAEELDDLTNWALGVDRLGLRRHVEGVEREERERARKARFSFGRLKRGLSRISIRLLNCGSGSVSNRPDEIEMVHQGPTIVQKI